MEEISGFRVREFAIGAAINGMLLHGGNRVYGGTFFVFADYLKAAMRVAAISHLPALHVYTYDQLWLGKMDRRMNQSNN